MSPTVNAINIGGFRFFFKSTEGAVEHVHVKTPSGVVLWWLGKDGPRVVSLKRKTQGVKASDMSDSKRYVEEHYDVIITAWHSFFDPHRTAATTFVYKIESKGFWLYHDTELYWIAFATFPVFHYATDDEIKNFQYRDEDFWWPDLDVDLDLTALSFPGRYPLRALHPRETGQYPRHR